ncbi:MAG: sigma 54-interacting transcriptional regulator [Deltaproteobacteria bacterium]|nr:sigma 54-interacting transcriptional regulator [Deltaproteobacteria bacterium]
MAARIARATPGPYKPPSGRAFLLYSPRPVDLAQFKKLHSIRLIRALIRKWWKLELAFADHKGYVIDHAEGKIFPSGNEFCRMALFSKDGFKRCNDSVKVVRDKVRARRRVFVHQCHLGFDVVAAPIHFGDRLVGFIFTGGSYHDDSPPVSKADLLKKVKGFAPDEAADLERAHRAIPRLSEAEMSHLAELIEYGAEQVMQYWNEYIKPRELQKLKNKERKNFKEIIGTSPAMVEIFDLLDKIVRSQTTVLVHGESGTGKELIARAIHDYGPRKKKAFVVQNCSAFNDNLLESALFGHIRGAFTGAVKDTKGLFEIADGGTFFLDEIGDMSPALQVKLLRVLQEGTFTPVGSTKQVKVDVRIIAASHKDLTKMVERGEFREDLYYRINVLKVTAPPLRDRLEDLQVLIDHFLKKHALGETQRRLSSETFEVMRKYNWPGNIRELENEIERLIVLSGDSPEIDASTLSPRIREALAKTQPEREPERPKLDFWGGKYGTLREMVESVESEVIHQGLIRTHWNKSQLAKELGISRSNLIQKCNYYKLDRKSQ